MPKGKNENDIGILDFETDPFLAGRVPYPFAACLYFGDTDFALLWDADSRTNFIERVVCAIRQLPECVLYAHNGGRFDFHFLIEYAERGTIKIRNGRIVEMRIGKVTLKDSFPLMPFALEEYKKTKIDYSIFEKGKRDLPINRRRIEEYLFDDCKYLRELLLGFRAVVGIKDTIGGCAFFQMRKLGLQIQTLNETHDDLFRQFYFGGRVQAFSLGVHTGRHVYLDINSAYPYAMLERHAHGAEYAVSKELPRVSDLGNCFVECVALSKGALPLRENDGSLSFPHGRFHFKVTGWEIAAGLETGTLEIESIINVWIPQTFICFREYIETFFALRQKAKDDGDEVKRLAYKYLLNSGYGKFAQNPREFKEYKLASYGDYVKGFAWESDYGAVSLWSRSSYHGFGFFDVATGASITGYVRAMLWRAICASKNVLYVDTDAMLCGSSSVQKGGALGQWKLEGVVKRAAIAGKKLYGIEWETPQKGQRYKIASKGARLDWREMLSLCEGDEIVWENEAPTFSINGAHFIKRRINATLKGEQTLAHMTTIYRVVTAAATEQSLQSFLEDVVAAFRKCSEQMNTKKRLRVVCLSESTKAILGVITPRIVKQQTKLDEYVRSLFRKEARHYKAPEIFKPFSLST